MLTATLTPTATTTPQSSTALDSDSYETLLKHFEQVSSNVLDIVKWIVLIIGGLGGVSSALGIRGAWQVQALKDETGKLEAKISKLRDDLEESRKLYMDATNRLRYFLEVRDRNPELRTRAAQQLGASNDIAAVSILIELLENDPSVDVKLEAAYGLGQLLSEGGEPGTLEEGVQALLEGTKDDSDIVRVEAVEALDTLICNDVRVPRTVYRRMQELVEHDSMEDVVKAAETVLEHLKKQREKKLNSPDPENN